METMRIWRPAVTFIELNEEPRFNLALVFGGEAGMDRSPRWLAYGPHLPEPVPVALDLLAILQQMPSGEPVERSELDTRHGERNVQSLLDLGLLIGDDAEPRILACDTASREVPWWTPALVAQSAGGWTGIDIQARYESGLLPNSQELVEANGPAPGHEYRRGSDDSVVPLGAPKRRDFDQLLAGRKTCRNFDSAKAVSTADLATMMHRVWGALGTKQLAPGAIAVKKTSPAGGGLHAVEAYLLVQRAEGLAPGIYHYLPMRHGLEPICTMAADEMAAVAYRLLAGQHWFANVPVMVVMTARFDRLFWKYRKHAKAWRVVHLDVGHLSQTMYLSAADLGLGAFVTAAINDREAESVLGLAPLREGAIAIVGFGPRAETRENVELDDLEPTSAALMVAAD